MSVPTVVRGRALLLALLARVGKWANQEAGREKEAESHAAFAPEGEMLIAVLAALDEVREAGFGRVTLTVKDGRVTHVAPEKLYNLAGGGAADLLASRDRDY